MILKTQQFVEKALERAEYQYDKSVKAWSGWINGFRGVYAQGESIEDVRQELAEVLEEFLFLSFQKRQKVSGFALKISQYAKAR